MTTRERSEHALIERLARTRESHRRRSRVYRALFAVAGAIVTLVGIAMLVLPGPALAVIPVGLFMLAMEFAWAERLLQRAIEKAEVAQQTARRTSRRQRVALAALTLVAAAGALTAAVLIDIPLLPV
jgi:uncharacterized protein (TIGR02611 family)